MELLPPVSASLGGMGSLAGKLDLVARLDAELKVEIRKLTSRLVLLSEAQDPPVEAMIWLKDVRELSYDMENCVDLAEPGWVRTMSGFKARVKEANERYDNCMLGSIPIVCSNAATDFQIPMVYPTLPFIRLHDGLFVDLCKWLTDDHVALKVASILGVGGIGKTTLAKQLWREHKRHFDCCAFVRTAKKPDMRRFLRSILAQVRPDQPPATNEVHQLIHRLRTHLQGKRYFLIIDDLWATSVWDVARRAFPEGNGSRIITTTEIKDVALACCRYQSKYIYKMEPLSTSHSEELFVGAVFGSGEEKSRQLDDVSKEMIRRCAGLPMAIISISSVLASQGEANTIQYRKQIQNILPTNATPVEVLKQVLIFCYKCLPSHLQTCLLYLSLYPENYIILKEDIVKQWVAEGFILAPREDKTEVAGNYFDKLVNMGLIQRIDVGYSNDVYYYAVHPMAHNLITSKSREENFMTVIDYSERTIGFPNKVSRLSLQFGSAKHATRPESIGLSHVRSLAFIGLKSCYYSSILEFKVLRVLILHIWADVPSTGVDLKPTSELVLLRSLHVTSNDTEVHLPDLTRGPKHLETLEINARVAAIPANIVHIRSWLHLRLGVGTEVPDLTGTLKIVSTLNPTVSLDDSIYSPDLVKSMKTMELLSPICGIPKWTGQLTNLCILKFVVRELTWIDICKLHKLPFLTVLSLHVLRPATGLLGFAPGGFTALEHFEFRCGVLRLRFPKGTMPNLQRLKLGFNAHRGEEYGDSFVGIQDLSSVQEISGMIGSAAGAVERDLEAAESAFRKAMGRHPNVSVSRADMVEELHVEAEKQHEIPRKHPSTSSEQTRFHVKKSQDVRGPAGKQHLIRGKHTQSYQTEIKQDFTSKREIKQDYSRDSQFIKRSGPAELTINGEGDLHSLDQVLVFHEETGLEKLTLERCPPLELKHLLMLTTLKTLIVNDSDRVVGQLGGQVDVEWQLPVWCPKLQELEISNCPEFSPLIPISWIESLHRVKIRRVKMLQEFTYSKSFVGVKLKITGKADLHSIDQVLVFDKETGLEKLTLERCPPLESKHLLMLTSLKTLIVKDSVGLVGPLGGGQSDVEWQLPVEYICIEGLDGNVGKELTELLRHLPRLSKLNIRSCKNIKKLVVGVDVQQTTLEASDMGGGEITAAAEEEDDGMLLFPPHLCDSLLELEFRYCQELVLVDLPTLVPGGGALQALRSLQSLTIWRSPKFLSTFSFSCHIFPSSLQFLRLWEVEGMGTLEPLSNLTSLTRLQLQGCGEDLKCQGLWSLLTTGGQLKELEVGGSHSFFADWDPNPRRALEQQPQLVSSTLQELETDDIEGLLAAPVCKFLSSSLTKLALFEGHGYDSDGMERFSKEQEDALQILSSIQELEFSNFIDLQQLPAGLRAICRIQLQQGAKTVLQGVGGNHPRNQNRMSDPRTMPCTFF
ncbi:hypothetical protein ZWY2020_046361 [Hordeum vulgare]|nr:hypothetical protein ZWY2020_046361 [Hordeum vulgare]